MAGKCEECGEALIGRADKRFCNDQCRSAHYQNRNADALQLIRQVNNQLKKNRNILASLNPEGKVRIKKSQLDREGFNYKLYTSTYTTRENKTYYFVYDQGYLPLDGDYIMLVINKEF